TPLRRARRAGAPPSRGARVTLTVLNPATEQPVAELEQAGVEETDTAVARARAAFPAWRAVAPADRARLLRRLATLVEEHAEELARIESENVGKPIAGARGTRGTLVPGAKPANVDFPHPNLEGAAPAAPSAVFDNARQDCGARSRILVEHSAYDRFVALLGNATRAVKVADPADEQTEMGPLI